MNNNQSTHHRIHIKPPISYYGGKQTLLSVILPQIPEHTRYIEPFLGGGAVFWAKKPSEIEVINDLDGFVTNFYRVVKTDFAALKPLVDGTVYGRESHERAATIRQMQAYFTPMQRAWAFFVLTNSSIYGILDNQCTFPGKDIKPATTFYNKVERFDHRYVDRLQNTFVEQRDAIYVIERNDSEASFFFVDPPYFNANMGHYAGYKESDFEALLATLSKVKGRFLLTCYPSDLLEKWLRNCSNWMADFREMSLSAGAKGKRKTEVLVRNY
ncbi:MAG: hypothetical protein EPGJADBJ_04494 [Saprospiraceae bacterium]|nr:hypothetical protein [Saprospiraceae bacterium]